MAVNPKLIMVAVEAVSDEKTRNTILKIAFFALGVVMLIFLVFGAFISGLLSIASSSDLINHWRYIRTTLSEVFDGIEGDIDTDVKQQVYDFMPDFSINLSKATISDNFDGNTLILYDEDEIQQAQATMTDFAEQLRGITSQTAFDEYIAEYETELTYVDITKVQFTDDVGIENISDYPDELIRFLYNRAMEEMDQYSYVFEEVTVKGKPADRQTLTVTDADGKEKIVEYTCIGGGEVYLPEFLAMYDVYQSREFLTGVDREQADKVNEDIAEAIGSIPETDEAAEKYLNDIWKNIIGNGKSSAIKINVFEVANLKKILEESMDKGAVELTVEQTDNKLSITLETVGSDMWLEMFSIDDELTQYVEQSQQVIELALDNAEIPVEERTLSFDNLVQLSLFQYFEGFFELPVSSSDLADGTNGILSQCGELSPIHCYNRGTKNYDSPEQGVTLHLDSGEVPVYANLLDCGNCIEDVIVYDVFDANDSKHVMSADVENKIYNQCAVTLAYVIDTVAFEKDYGFPFPSIDGITNDTVTLLVEYSCLDRLDGLSDLDIGYSLYSISDGSLCVGYSHSGDFDSTRDFVTGEFSWYHTMNKDENTPHFCIKTVFVSGGVSVDTPESHHTYEGLTVDFGVRVNPRLWFKGFRTGMDEELFETLSAIQP